MMRGKLIRGNEKMTDGRAIDYLRLPFNSPLRKMGYKGVVFYLVFCFFLLASSAHALDVPKLQGYVNDYANMISPSARAELTRELQAFEQSDSTQIAILTIPSLEGEAVEDLAIKVAENWKVGQKNKDNGAILLVAKQERKIRIEVGRGLEGRLTDLMSGRIVDLVIKPRFKRGDFDGGFVAGISAMIDATRGEFKADGNHQGRKRDSSFSFLSILIFCGFVMLILGSISRILGGVAGAAMFAGLVHLLPISAGLAAYLVSAILGFGAGMLLPTLFSSGGRGGGGFWFGGPGFGGGFGGGGFSGGGFSGGGGSFGGGGASGDW